MYRQLAMLLVIYRLVRMQQVHTYLTGRIRWHCRPHVTRVAHKALRYNVSCRFTRTKLCVMS